MRPRANTISHVGGGTVGMMSGETAATPPRPPQHGHSHHPSLGGVSGPSFDLRSMPSDNRHNSLAGLSKLDTSSLSLDMSDGLRTAPVFGSFESNYNGLNDMLIGHGSTINPAQLHFGSPSTFTETPTSPFRTPFPSMPAAHDQGMPDHDTNNYDWMKGFENTMTFTNESAIDGSSPSAMSTGSQSGVSEAVPDAANHGMISSAGPWQNAMLAQAQAHAPAPAQSHPQSNHLNVDFSGSIFQELCPPDTVSPKTLVGHGSVTDATFATPPPQTPMTPSVFSGAENVFSQSNTGHANVTNGHVDPFNNPGYFPPAQPIYVNSITDSTRQSLMSTLQQPSGFNHRRFSQPSANASVTPPGTFSRANVLETNSYVLPSTPDLQRYITAYVNYFHPHVPFLHIPTLDFSAPGYANNSKTSGGNGASAKGDSGCLILSMAAIGALYEFDTATSKELFECAKKTIQLYLEERRKADMSAAMNGPNRNSRDSSVRNTPLWLVQAMLLNVIYGHNCEDKTSADIASTHSAALVTLARAADLMQSHSPDPYQTGSMSYESPTGEAQMNGTNADPWASNAEMPQEKMDWLTWKNAEERKRTLYAIFVLSSLLVTAYNHAPALPNSQINLGLPCEEHLWTADSPQAWMALGGTPDMDQHSVKFTDALKVLLVAGQQSQHAQHNQFGTLSIDNLKPSTFGCLVLINALHNYIWETRQRHMGKQWTNQETEAMHLHLEPALRAWQTVWSRNPHHRVERPNPFGLGPLSADSVPLLDLAYIRLYVNLGRSKEAFWQRDWDGMTDELSKVAEVMSRVDVSPGSDFTMSNHVDSDNTSPGTWDSGVDYAVSDLSISNTAEATLMQHSSHTHSQVTTSKNERHLRAAAFYAADSLCMSDKFGSTYAEYTSRELPVQSAMCAFDCAQVLAEWVAAIQDRIGPYIHAILGQTTVDFTQMPAIMLLEDEDYTLINKIEEFLSSTESKMKEHMTQFGSPGGEAFNCLPSLVEGGYGTKILFATAYLLNRAGVWPGEFF